MPYKALFANFAYAGRVKERVEAMIAEAEESHHKRADSPRISALLSNSDVQTGMRLLKNGMPTEYRCLEYLLFSELVPGWRESLAEAVAAGKQMEDVLSPEQLTVAREIVVCGLSLMVELYKTYYPDLEHDVPWKDFVATVRRASAMGDLPGFASKIA